MLGPASRNQETSIRQVLTVTRDNILETIATSLVELNDDTQNKSRVVVAMERGRVKHGTKRVDKGHKLSRDLKEMKFKTCS